MPTQKIEKREYCERCGEDVTIIRLHTCKDGNRYADYGNVIYSESPIEIITIFNQLSQNHEKEEE